MRNQDVKRRPARARFPLAGCMIVALMAGCIVPPPRMYPADPVLVRSLHDGRLERVYDSDRDGRIDCGERLGPDGVIVSLCYDTTGDGRFDDIVELADILPQERRHLLIILDSVPFSMVEKLWQTGRFRGLHPPVPLISTFPATTDVALNAFLGVGPRPGMEPEYYNGEWMVSGKIAYWQETKAEWARRMDYFLDGYAHGYAYLWPRPWFGYELARIKGITDRSRQPLTLSYAMGTSALGAGIGRAGHEFALDMMDRYCRTIMFEHRGRVQITLMSDHGHDLIAGQWISLPIELGLMGYRLTGWLESPEDVIIPEFGLVTCAGIHTLQPKRVAEDVVKIEGVELAFYLNEADEVVVVGREGQARIARSGDRYRYTMDAGDPLELAHVWHSLAEKGLVDADGFVDDEPLFAATATHVFPDPLHRLWHGFHGLIIHTPDVMVSVSDGYYCGLLEFAVAVGESSSHGSLTRRSSTGFAMSSAGPLPGALRIENLRGPLCAIGVPIDDAEIASRKGMAAK